MKKNVAREIVVITVSISTLFANTPPAFPIDIITLNGNIYSNVTIKRVEPDGISIKHSAGIIKLFINELPDDMLIKYGLTQEEANRYQSQRSAALNAREMQMQENINKRNIQWAKDAQQAQIRANPKLAKAKVWNFTIRKTDRYGGTWGYTDDGVTVYVPGHIGGVRGADGQTLSIFAYDDGILRDEGKNAIFLSPVK